MMKKIFFLILFSLPILKLNAQQVSDVEFKNYKDSVNAKIKGLEKKVNDGKDALEKAEKLYEQADKHISLSERFDTFFLSICGLGIAIIGAILGIVGFNVINSLKDLKNIKEELRTKIVQELLTEKSLIDKTLGKTSVEETIKTTKRIIIVSKKDDNNQPLNTLKNSNNFKEVDVKIIENDFAQIDINNADLIILDNENGTDYHWKLSDNELKNNLIGFVQNLKSKNKKFIYFGKQDPVADGGLIRDSNFQEKSITSFCSDINNLEDYIIKLLK